MITILKKNICLTIGIAGTFFYFLPSILYLNYDDSGFEGILFWLSQLFSLHIWLPSEFIFLINNGEAIPFHKIISTILGLYLCLGIDFILHKKQGNNVKHE